MTEKTTLEGLVCQNRMPEAIEELKSMIQDLSQEPLNNLVALSGRYNANRKADEQNTAPQEMTDMETNRIRASFLSILTDVREEIQSKINFFKPIPRAVKDRDILRDFIETVLSRKYRDIEPFSEGTSFIYFSAVERYSNQDVMVMVLKSSDIEDFKKGNQLSRISNLKHRNLVQMLDVNFQTYPFFITTEFVSGVNLRILLDQVGALPMHIAKRLLMVIGDVMDYLRHKKFPYSGIRPSKIIIDQDLEPEVSPFDILRVSEAKRTVKSFIEDSHYYAPEKLYDSSKDNNSEATDKANQFCLGSLAFEILTGEKLFYGNNVSQILHIRERFFTDPEFRKARLAHPRLPTRMSAILKKMLAESPDKRYEDLLHATKEITKVRVVLDDQEELVFASYRRCLSHADNFFQSFFEHLFSHSGMADLKPQTKAQTEFFFQRVHIAIHLMFDIENMLPSVENATRLSPLRNNTASQNALILNTFVETVAECDPRWSTNKATAGAWEHVKDRILAALPVRPSPDEAVRDAQDTQPAEASAAQASDPCAAENDRNQSGAALEGTGEVQRPIAYTGATSDGNLGEKDTLATDLEMNFKFDLDKA